MRLLVVDPGPAFSVQDVADGWHDALAQLAPTQRFNTGDVLTYHSEALKIMRGYDGAELQRHSCNIAAQALRAAVFDWQPDVVVIVSAFYIPPETWDVIRRRGAKIVALLTESPYEDDRQIPIGNHADLVIVNDPTNLDRFREVNPNTHYLPHAYDPKRHHRMEVGGEYKSDFCFVGTGFPSRVEFFEQVDWTGVDAAFAGHWQGLTESSPLFKFLTHHKDACNPNDETVRLYSGCKVSANLYRKEAQRPELSEGWAMGPREVELAATGTFFLGEERPERCEVLPMVPTFDGPQDFSEKLRWWLDHDREREDVAARAQAAIADRTFDNHAKWLLDQL